MIAEGTYTARAQGTPIFAASKKGSEYVSIDMQITAGEHAGERLPWRGWLTPRAAPYTSDSLRALGWDGDTLTNLGPLDTEVQIVVVHETYEGTVSARIRYVNAIGHIPSESRLSEEQVRALDERLRGWQDMPPMGDTPVPDDDGLPF